MEACLKVSQKTLDREETWMAIREKGKRACLKVSQKTLGREETWMAIREKGKVL